MITLFHIGFLNFNWIDALDICLVSVLFYQLYRLLRGSVAVKIIIGLIFIYFAYLLINASGMELLSAIFGQFIGVGMLAAVILFQQEIRRFLLFIGTTTQEGRIFNLFRFHTETEGIDSNIIVKAAEEMAETKTGALMVLRRSSDLTEYEDSGDRIEAVVSKRLILAIFNKTSPMHDGAMVIEGDTIKAVRCIIPVSENPNLPAQYGLRHRAAIGITEVTDAVVVIVSEETGSISVAADGEMHYHLAPAEARSRINRLMTSEEESSVSSQA